MTYILIGVLVTILYIYRHLALVLLFKCVLSDTYPGASSIVSVYSFPNQISTKSYFAKTVKGTVLVRQIGNKDESTKLELEELGTLPFFRYFVYSALTFIFGCVYGINFFVLSVFFKKSLVRKMLFIFEWLREGVFKILFKKYFSNQIDDMVLF